MMHANTTLVVNAVGESIAVRDARIESLEAQVEDLRQMLGVDTGDADWVLEQWREEPASSLRFRLEAELRQGKEHATRLESDVRLFRTQLDAANRDLEAAQEDVAKKTDRIDRYRTENTELRAELERVRADLAAATDESPAPSPV